MENQPQVEDGHRHALNSDPMSDPIFAQQDVIEYLRRKGLSDETIQRLQVVNSESVSFPVCDKIHQYIFHIY